MGIFNAPTPPIPYWGYAILSFPSKFCDPSHPLPNLNFILDYVYVFYSISLSSSNNLEDVLFSA